MEKKQLKSESPAIDQVAEALQKEFSLQKDGDIRVQLELSRTGEDWILKNFSALSSNGDSTVQVTELKKQVKAVKRKLKAAEQQLIKQEKLASLGLLTAGIAHEIKNPLNFITNFSDLSLEYLEEIKKTLQNLEKSEAIEEALALLGDIGSNLTKIQNHGHRAEGIVRSMLLHSRGANDNYEPVDLNNLIREYVNLAFHGMRANRNPINVEMRLDLEPGIGMVTLNAESFSRVILNLCKNAFDAMREKKDSPETSADYKPRLKVSSRADNDKFVVTVEDNGPGVPKDLQKKILTPFFTTKKGVEGTGLGLSITKEILQEHKASLAIESKEGEFTRFIIELKKEL